MTRVASFVSVLLLTACGGSLSPGSAPASKLYENAVKPPGPTAEDLLYVSDFAAKKVYVYTFPGLETVGSIAVDAPAGICADVAGNVWVSNISKHEMEKYSHGGTQPIARIADPHFQPNGCSVDPVTGDLAVVNQTNDNGNIAIFRGGTGHRRLLNDTYAAYPQFCAYDASGNLYVDGVSESKPWALTELPYGKDRFFRIKTSVVPWPQGAPLQWDGEHMTITTTSRVYRLAIRNRKATVVGITRLQSGEVASAWIHGGYLAGANFLAKSVQVWKYPAGGNPTGHLKGFFNAVSGVAISPKT